MYVQHIPVVWLCSVKGKAVLEMELKGGVPPAWKNKYDNNEHERLRYPF